MCIHFQVPGIDLMIRFVEKKWAIDPMHFWDASKESLSQLCDWNTNLK